MLYRGTGGDFAPNVPLLDAALGKGLMRLGFRGDRAPGKGMFATASMEMAQGYVGVKGELVTVDPLPGARVTWVAGVNDLVTRMGTWLRWARPDDLSKGAASLLSDVSGDVCVLDTYLSMGRQRKAIAEIVDAFLAGFEVREFVVDGETDVLEMLGGHVGEVWITGPCLIESFQSPLPGP